jgi:hypothetical protein
MGWRCGSGKRHGFRIADSKKIVSFFKYKPSLLIAAVSLVNQEVSDGDSRRHSLLGFGIIFAMAKLSKILIFPIKSLDAIALGQVEISNGGALKGDREFALLDQSGRYFNAKRSPKFHLLRTSYDLPERLVSIEANQGQFSPITFHLDRDRQDLASWFSEFFEQPLELNQNTENGFPDDPEAWGATVVAEASLKVVQSWYPALNLEQIRLRFRTNLEVEQTEVFWEDKLFAKAGETVAFKIGDVQFLGTNPCQRCPVPTRDPFTGEIYPDFQKIFSQQRELTLALDTERSRFNHFYRLALNTQIPLTEAGKVLKLGDPIMHYSALRSNEP